MGWGEGSAEVQPKAQVCPVFFMKPSLIKKVENLVTMSQIVCMGGLPPSICSQIQKSLKLIREGGGQHFSNKSKIQKSLKYPIRGGGQAYLGKSPQFSRFLIMMPPLKEKKFRVQKDLIKSCSKNFFLL